MGYSLWGHKESDMTKGLITQHSTHERALEGRDPAPVQAGKSQETHLFCMTLW